MVKQKIENWLNMEWAFTKFVMPIFGVFFTIAVTIIGYTVNAQLEINEEMSKTLNVMSVNQAVGNISLINIDKTLQTLQHKQDLTDGRVTNIELDVEKVKGTTHELGQRVSRIEQDFKEAKNEH